MRLTLATALALLPLALNAAPPVLRFPGPAEETAARAEDPGRMGFPVAGFDGAGVPMERAEGRLEQRAWRLAETRQTTLALLSPLSDQLAAAGFKTLFDCDATACGGFDFRYAMEVLPEPAMHVDLGDYRYLVARNAAGELVSLLVSRALDQGFVQMTWVGPSTAGAAALVAPAPQAEAPPAPPVPAAEAPAGEPAAEPAAPPAPGSLGAALQEQGVAVLDDLIFASGKAALEEGDYPSLAALVAWLAENPASRVTLVGHTDATGGLAGNIALSRARAEAVRQRLVQLGADAARIDAEGAGYLAPRATNQTPEGRERNRRVEVMLNAAVPE